MSSDFYETKKKRGLILTEGHVRQNGSNLSIHPEGGGGSATPYTRLDGPSQWDRQKKRYRTFDEQQAYVRHVRALNDSVGILTRKQVNKILKAHKGIETTVPELDRKK